MKRVPSETHPKRPRRKKTPDGSALCEHHDRSTEAERTARAIRNFKETGQAAPLNNKIPLEDKAEPEATEVPRVQIVTPIQIQQPNQNVPANPSLPKLEF